MENEVLWNILANPADAKYAYSLNIQSLVDEYPQSGLLRALLAGNGNQQNVQHSAVYINPATLYKLINNPEGLPVVSNDQIVQVEEPVADTGAYDRSKSFTDPFKIDPTFHIPHEEVEELETEEDVEETDHHQPGETEYYPHAEEADVKQDLSAIEFETQEPEVIEAKADEVWANEPTHAIIDTFVEPESVVNHEEAPAYTTPVEPAPVYEAYTPESQPEPIYETYTPEPQQEVKAEEQKAEEPAYKGKTEYFHQDIEDEIYDEIVSIEDINLEQLATFHSGYVDDEDKPAEVVERMPDNFMYDPGFTVQQNSGEKEEQEQPVYSEPVNNTTPLYTSPVTPAWEAPKVTEKSNISNYNDEKLPYSFMWWLDKTRREYAATYQPYVYNNVPPVAPTSTQQQPQAQPQQTKRNTADELEHQYVENIYNLNAVDQLERNNSLKPYDGTATRKEDKIIEKFIKTEPHMQHPSGIKLDNENKAKRSSEDANELVTETLARIYTEQMLYPKAISTYKKLMLKFPEKSLYFAGQIEQLEKKPN